MDRTNANEFRTNLKEWMEAAREEPIKITRKSGEAFVLMTSDEFEATQVELAELRGLAQGLSDAIQGKVKKSSETSLKSAVQKVKSRITGKQKAKKAAG